jgi:two-component system, CitB family, sensor kinase
VTIVGNLIDNALDALGETGGGRIGVRLEANNGRVVIEVRDDGPGIPPDALARIFEPGWSTKSSQTRSRGLGLALVSATAARLGGRVDARNDGGAVLVVDVPARARLEVG